MSMNSYSNNSTTKDNKDILNITKNAQEKFNQEENKSMDDEATEVRNFLNILDKEPDFSSSKSTSSIFSNSSFNKVYSSHTRKPKTMQN